MSAYDITRAEEILLAEEQLCGSEAHRILASVALASRFGVAFQLAAPFREVNLILGHLHTTGCLRALVLFASRNEDEEDSYVPDASGFHAA